MKVLLLELDGKLPNVALMRLAEHHRAAGDEVAFRRAHKIEDCAPQLWESPDKVYASCMLRESRHRAERVLEAFPDSVVGGTGWDLFTTLEQAGVETLKTDYSIYPEYRHSIGFLSRGCRRRCPFCVVPRKEGPMRMENSVWTLWRGDPHPRELVLLDNDFFGSPFWEHNTDEIRQHRFKVCLTQGVNVRNISEDQAAALAAIDTRDLKMERRRVYTAWDYRKDEAQVFRGLELLVRSGIKPDQIMVYMLIGYFPWCGLSDWEERRKRLREFGARPYPMPFHRTELSIGFQRWVVGAYDKRVPWEDWERAGYQPGRLGLTNGDQTEFSLEEGG